MRAEMGEHRGVVIRAAAKMLRHRLADLAQVIRAGHDLDQLPVRREHAAKLGVVGGGKDA